MSEIINYTRLTTSDKLADRFLTCQVYEPVDPEQAQSGKIFSQIEISNPWFPTAQIGQTVINTLIREYYRGVDTSELVNFENAIKKVNEALAQIAQNGETDWIGKFSGCFILISGLEAHFAQTGTSHAYLYRGAKVNHITEGLDTGEAPHPLKTFSNITSGTLQIDDKIVIGNAALFEIISPQELKTIVSSFRPTTAAIETAKIIKSRGTNNANAIFLESTTKESLANIPPDQKQETIYIDHQSGVDIKRTLKSIYKKIIHPAGRAIGRGTILAARAGKNYLGPKLARGWKVTKVASSKMTDRALKTGRETQARIKERFAENQNNNPDQKIASYEDTGTRKSRILPKTSFLKIKNKVRRYLIRIGFYSKDKSKMILAIMVAVLLVLAVSVTIGLLRRAGNNKEQALAAKQTQIMDLQNSASIKLAKKDESGALLDFKSIVSLSQDLANTKYAADVQPAVDKALAKVKEISKLTSVVAVKTVDTSGDILKSDIISGEVVGIFKSGDIKVKSATDPLFIPVSKADLPSEKIISSVSLVDDKLVAYIFSNKKLATVSSSGKNFALQNILLNYAGELSSFAESIYVLDQPSNQIWKLVPDNGKYSGQTGYIKDKTNISDGVDLAIDGSAYVLTNTGKITRFSRGNKADETDIKLPVGEIISTYSRIFTNESTGSLFVVSSEPTGARIVEVKKGGNFVAQYSLDQTAGFSDISIDPSAREISVVAGSKVLEFKI